MAEEVVKQETKIETPPPADTPAKEPEVKVEPTKPKLPEKGFFTGDTMEKFVEEMGLGEEEPPKKEEKKVELKEGEEECPECPEGKRKIEPSKDEKREPIEILKVDGKDIPVYSKEELKELAQKGKFFTQERQKDADWERSLKTREGLFEQRLEKVAGPLQQLVNIFGSKQGQQILAKETGEEEEEALLDLDPEVKKILDKQNEEIKALKDEVNITRERSAEHSLDKAKETLNTIVNKAREDHPFDDIPAGEGSEESISQKLFGGLIASKVSADNIRAKLEEGFQRRQLPELVVEASKNLHDVEEYYRSKFGKNSGGELPANTTVEQLVTKYPEQVKTLAQNAIASYLKEQGKKAPTVKAETSVEARTPKTDKKFKNLEDAFKQAEDSPEMEAMMEELNLLSSVG